MNARVEKDMKWSSKLFLEEVWPMVKKHFGGGELMPMEGRPDMELATLLDMRAGIDGWHLMEDGGIRGIASRIQKGDKVWATFTVRKSRNTGAATEFEKRKEAIFSGRGQIYPHLTVHAYAKTEAGPVMAAAVCKTSDLIAFIDKGLATVRPTDNAEFYACPWHAMKEAGFIVRIETAPEP
jgi:hypothetical protein